MKIKSRRELNARIPRRTSITFPVVGVGASAGGLDAFKKFLKAIPEKSGMAFVLVQHLDPKHESLLPELLQKITKIPVSQITDDVAVEPHHIYIIPSNKMLVATDGVLQLSPRPSPGKTRNHPIDLFFKSLAEVHQAQSIGVVLSGTGFDGTEGLKEIKDHGGITFAQDEQSSSYPGMPIHAVQARVVDFVLPPEQIAPKLVELIGAMGGKDENAYGLQTNGNQIKQILSLLRLRKGTDFTYYKDTTIKRRIARRMAVQKMKSTADYLKYMRRNIAEQDLLYQDLLIPVTAFFRDHSIFDKLAETILPLLARNRKAGEPLRIWVAGCSTGEEAYSLAMCVKEFEGNPFERVQIFATDLSETAVAKARLGVYSKNSVSDLSPKRLKAFFSKTESGYQISKDIREMCVFAVHDFLRDPPFGRIDFISCRNVLIYMEPYLQKKALTTFHYAINPKGLLLLGKSESIGQVPDLFAATTRSDKIFIRKNTPGKQVPVNRDSGVRLKRGMKAGEKGDVARTDFQKAAHDIILNEYTPSGIIVNEAMDVVHFHGDNSAWLQLSAGKPSLNLSKLAKPGLAFELRSLILKARKEKKAVSTSDIQVVIGGSRHAISLEVRPLPNIVEPHFLVLFHELPGSPHGVKSKVKGADTRGKKGRVADARVGQLERELAQTREDMNSITEDQEAVNEELQSANEELQSSSEELQSLNEELETSKEEVQSTNEELVALNQELVALNEQLIEERDYGNAILATVRGPLIILDSNFNVKSANKHFYETFKVVEAETEGKSLFELGNKQWESAALRKLFGALFSRISVILNFEVSHDFPSIGKRVMILNAREIVRDGGKERLALLAFEDVTDRRKAEQILRNSEERFRHLVKDLPAGVYSCDTEGHITYFNQAAEKMWGRKPELGKEQWCGSWKMLRADGSYMSADQCPMAIALKERRAIVGEEITIERPDGSRSIVQVYPQPVFDLSGQLTGAINMAIDVTDQKLASDKVRESEERLRHLAAELEMTVSERTKELLLANNSLQEKNAQLMKVNKELESFTYISSHDLQEPLRKIQVFTSRILQKDLDALSEVGKDSFTRIKDAAMRMQTLIKDLLSYSRSVHDNQQFQKKDLHQIVLNVLDELKETITDTKAEIEVAELGEANVIPFQIHQLLYNLIGNSLKFAAPGRPPQIKIDGEVGKGSKMLGVSPDLGLLPHALYRRISVTDNGIGFEPEFRKRIFDVFRRLHVDGIYPGTGIGLAIVKRIAENHGGIVDATGELNKGARIDVYISETLDNPDKHN